jgi:anti-anti-sigma regulatory factor
MTVRLPEPEGVRHPLAARSRYAGNPMLLPSTTREELRFRVRLVPARLRCDVKVEVSGATAELFLRGTLDDEGELAFRKALDEVLAAQPERLVLQVGGLDEMSSRCARAIAFYRENMPLEMDIEIVGLGDDVRTVLERVGFLEKADIR